MIKQVVGSRGTKIPMMPVIVDTTAIKTRIAFVIFVCIGYSSAVIPGIINYSFFF